MPYNATVTILLHNNILFLLIICNKCFTPRNTLEDWVYEILLFYLIIIIIFNIFLGCTLAF